MSTFLNIGKSVCTPNETVWVPYRMSTACVPIQLCINWHRQCRTFPFKTRRLPQLSPEVREQLLETLVMVILSIV